MNCKHLLTAAPAAFNFARSEGQRLLLEPALGEGLNCEPTRNLYKLQTSTCRNVGPAARCLGGLQPRTDCSHPDEASGRQLCPLAYELYRLRASRLARCPYDDIPHALTFETRLRQQTVGYAPTRKNMFFEIFLYHINFFEWKFQWKLRYCDPQLHLLVWRGFA